MHTILVMFLVYSFMNEGDSIKDCKRNFSVRKNAIILTKLSLLHGAEFIHKQKVDLFQDCYALCCSNPKCTVAVYDNKQHHSCYMFNCMGINGENACLFTEHGHYTAMLEMPNKAHKTRTKVSKQKFESTNKNDGKVASKVTPVDAGLGEMCGQLRKCGPINSMCTSGTCICQNGYLGQNGKCVRSVCPKPELMYQCADTSKMPFCVAVYDRCNGLSECGDGSDEVDCPNKSKGPSYNSNISKPMNKLPPQSSKSISDTGIKVSHIQKPHQRPKSTKHTISSDSRTQQSNNRHTNFPWSHTQQDTNPNPDLGSESKLGGHYNISPLAENQLLLLESKNSIPKFKSEQHSGIRNRNRVQKQQIILRKETQKDKELYRKLKQQVYPHNSKYEDYYSSRRSSSNHPTNNRPDHQTASHTRNWNDLGLDYEYSPNTDTSNSNSNRNVDADIADWYKSNSDSSDRGTGSSQYDSSSRYYSPNENRYKNFYQPSPVSEYEEESGTNPRGRYISDTDMNSSPRDYYSPSGNFNSMSSNSNSRTSNNRRRDNFGSYETGGRALMGGRKTAVNKIFIKPKDFDSKARMAESKTGLQDNSENKKSKTTDKIDSENTQEFGTAIIALSLGLLITAVLLVTIAIKMRMWRKRLRRSGKKHKSLTTDENDYLINGMYL